MTGGVAGASVLAELLTDGSLGSVRPCPIPHCGTGVLHQQGIHVHFLAGNTQVPWELQKQDRCDLVEGNIVTAYVRALSAFALSRSYNATAVDWLPYMVDLEMADATGARS